MFPAFQLPPIDRRPQLVDDPDRENAKPLATSNTERYPVDRTYFNGTTLESFMRTYDFDAVAKEIKEERELDKASQVLAGLKYGSNNS